MHKKPEHIIWSDFYFDPEDFREDYECWSEDEGFEWSDEDLYRYAAEVNADYLDDERANLSINVPGGIIAVASLGLWNGRVMGYKEVGYNIADCLRSQTEYTTWYIDELGDLACEGIHHDGTNHIIYRAWKSSASEEQRENLLDKIYYGKATRRDITRLTRRLGDDVADVYGWKIRGRKSKACA